MNFHAKSGVCSSKNEQVMLNLVLGADAVPVTNVHMVVKLQCEQFMCLKAQNTQYVSCPSDKTVLQNLLVNISIESLEALRHEECLKIALALFQVILLETSKRPIFSSSCSTSSSSRNFKNSSF